MRAATIQGYDFYLEITVYNHIAFSLYDVAVVRNQRKVLSCYSVIPVITIKTLMNIFFGLKSIRPNITLNFSVMMYVTYDTGGMDC